MESNRVIAGTIGLFVVICLVGAVLAPMINDWATGERITNEGAGWLRMDYTEVTESSNYSMAVSIAGGTITVTDTNSATQSGADDTIAYASSNLAIWTDSGTIQILGTDPDGNPYYATASSSVNVWYTLVLGQIIKIDGSEDAITFATPTWAYIPLANGTYGFFDNGTSVQMEEGKSIVAVGGGFAGVYAYSNLIRYEGLGLEMQTTQDADGLLNGVSWAKAAVQQDQRQLNPITLDPLDPGLIRMDDPDVSVRSVPTPTYTSGDWGYDTTTIDGETKAIIVSYSGAGGDVVVPATIGGYEVYRLGKSDPATNASYTVFNNSGLSANSTLTISNGIIEIGGAAVTQCSNFVGALIIPDSVTAIGNYSFRGCTGFTSLKLSSSLETLYPGSFRQCSGLTGNLILPDGLKTIGNQAFSNTAFTGSLIIPDGVTTLGEYTFSNMTGLNDVVVVPASVTALPQYLFTGSSNVKTLIIASDGTAGYETFKMNGVQTVLDLSDTEDYSVNGHGLPNTATFGTSIGNCLGYISFIEKGSDPLVPSGAAAVMLAIPVVILGALIVVAATTFIRKE